MSKRQEIREKQRQRERNQRILAILGLAIVGVAVVGIMISATLPRATGKILEPKAVRRSQVNMNTMGDPNAPVKVVEYADFQCPYCMHFYRDTEAKIIETYVNTGKVYFEYQPVVIVGAESALAAEAAYCAGDQGKFWEMHDILYANQPPENSGAWDNARMKELAAHIKLDTTKFNACLDGGNHKAKVEQAGQAAMDSIHAAPNFTEIVEKTGYPAEGFSTPTFLINGSMLPGAGSFTDFQTFIDAALAAAGK